LDRSYRRSGYFRQIFFHRMTLVKGIMVVLYNINGGLITQSYLVWEHDTLSHINNLSHSA
jgi:hypothetical protein